MAGETREGHQLVCLAYRFNRNVWIDEVTKV